MRRPEVVESVMHIKTEHQEGSIVAIKTARTTLVQMQVKVSHSNARDEGELEKWRAQIRKMERLLEGQNNRGVQQSGPPHDSLVGRVARRCAAEARGRPGARGGRGARTSQHTEPDTDS